MKFHRRIETALIAIVLGWAIPGPVAAADGADELVFIVAADMRSAATGPFSDACEAIKSVGPGSFMISPGDLDADPPSAAREQLDQYFGKDYPWYPAIGNHGVESPSTMRYLRGYDMTLPRVVNRGPAGCESTTYSFDWGNSHFAVLNLYFDGVRDWGTKGEVVPKLMEWLKADLAATTKKHIFVIGHEPLLPIPDMDNGRIRHQGNSLDQDAENAFEFHQLLLEHGVDAYICAHTHGVSYAKINGLWQLDPGHARGLEQASYADAMYAAIQATLADGKKRGDSESTSLAQLYRDDAYHVDKWFEYLGLKDQPVIQTLAQFYDEYGHDASARTRYYEAQIKGRGQTRSAFMRFIVGEDVTVEIYRDDGHGGPYILRKTIVLD